MKKTILTAAVLAASLLSIQSCRFIRINENAFSGMGGFAFNGSGMLLEPGDSWESVSYEVEDFSSILSKIPADLKYEMSDSTAWVEIYAPENYLDYMHFKVEDGTICVEYDEPVRTRTDGIRILVRSSGLERLILQGAGDFFADSLVCDRLDVKTQGAGDVTLEKVVCKEDFSVLIQGAGDVRVRNLECMNADGRIQGAGDIRLAGKAENASLTIQGAGEIHIEDLSVSGETKSSVQGVGKIYRPGDED